MILQYIDVGPGLEVDYIADLAMQVSVSARAVLEVVGLQGDLARAEKWLTRAEMRSRESLEMLRWRESGDSLVAISIVIRVAGLATALGESRRAARLSDTPYSWHETIGLPAMYQPHRRRERDKADAREALGEDAFARAWAEGQAMTLERAVENALQVRAGE